MLRKKDASTIKVTPAVTALRTTLSEMMHQLDKGNIDSIFYRRDGWPLAKQIACQLTKHRGGSDAQYVIRFLMFGTAAAPCAFAAGKEGREEVVEEFIEWVVVKHAQYMRSLHPGTRMVGEEDPDDDEFGLYAQK